MINVTELAAEKLKQILVDEEAEGSSLRVILMPGANGGAQYMLALENDPKSDDTLFETGGVSIVVDTDSASLMEGAEIDYADGLMQSGFVINNPNIEQISGCGGGGACGCGAGGGGCGCGAGGTDTENAGGCGAGGGGGCACGGH